MQNISEPNTQNAMMQLMGTQIYSIQDLCDKLQVSRQTLFNWGKAGLLKPRKIGRRTYYLGADVLNALEHSA